MFDCIIVGSGPAGIQTSLYLKHKNILVLGQETNGLNDLDLIKNLYGFDEISGPELMRRGILSAQNQGILVNMESVLSIEKMNNHFKVITTKKTYETLTVLLATGKPRIPLKKKGFLSFRGRGIHMCSSCDGFFYKNKKIALIGSGPYMLEELKVLENFTTDITIFTDGADVDYVLNYPIVKEEILEFIGEKRLNKIETINNTYEVSGAFCAIGFPQANDLALKLGIITENSNIIVDNNYETNIKGVFAAGDCIGGMMQITKALNDALGASIGILDYLRNI